MTLFRGQKAIVGVLLTVIALLAGSIRMSCSTSGSGSISIRGGKGKLKPMGNAKPFKPAANPVRASHDGRGKL
jgi:hypothetical protein